jgi:8-oxo-dGTP pyrophosphatase MutT (NUDIX family)
LKIKSIAERVNSIMGYVEEIRHVIGTRPLLLPGAIVLVVDAMQGILLQQRLDGSWGLPGGVMELGESCEETARREIFEEAGLTLGALELVGVISGEDQHIFCSNGDEVYSVTVAYATREFTGELVVDFTESLAMRFFAPDELPRTEMTRNARYVVDKYSGDATKI